MQGTLSNQFLYGQIPTSAAKFLLVRPGTETEMDENGKPSETFKWIHQTVGNICSAVETFALLAVLVRGSFLLALRSLSA